MNWKVLLLTMAILQKPIAAQTIVIPGVQFGFAEADPARDQYNSGRDLFEDGKYAKAEAVLREVVRKYPKHEVADKAHYYLIRSLGKQGKVEEAKAQIDLFEKTYPKSTWLTDVRQERLKLTNEVPPAVMAAVIAQPAAWTPAPPQAAPVPFRGVQPGVPTPTPTPSPVAVRTGRPGRPEESPEVRLQREALRVLFEANADRAIEIATERLKSDPVDAVALGNLYMVAQSRSDKALPMLVTLARTSPDSRTRKEAVTWIGRARGEKDAIAEILISLVPAMVAEDDSSSIAYALSEVNTTKSIEALASMARDRSKSDRVRMNALSWIAESRASNRLSLLEDIYKGTMDNSRIRRQVLPYIARSKDPQAVRILAGAASSDPDQTVKLEAVSQLGQIKTPEALKALEDLLMKKP